MVVSGVDAILFDVFGTVVDWRSGVIRDGEKLGEEKGLDVDWAAFADAWRGEYGPSLERVRRGEVPWTQLDDLHRASLERLLDRFGIEGLTGEEIDYLNRSWHRLDPWPDSIPGLRRLRQRYLVAPLSNGHIMLLVNMAKRAGLPWDLILSAELSGHYKPDPETYLTCVRLLDLSPGQVMMAAAHAHEAARKSGLCTAFIHRPLEWGSQRAGEIHKPEDSEYDVVADDILDLAKKLGT